MDAHFDPTQFHPTFLGSDNSCLTDNFHNISMDSFLTSAHEYGLPDDVIHSAVAEAYDFFGMKPAMIIDGNATFVQTGNPYTYEDDRLSINRDELTRYGVHDKNTLSLVCTHEIAHQLTQFMYASGQVSPWQSELISDKWMGFRAAAQGMDVQKVLDTFAGFKDSPDHPGEDLRCEHIRQAYDTMLDFIDRNVPVDFNLLMDTATHQIQCDPDIAARESQFHLQTPHHEQSYAYTQAEKDSHIREAQNRIDFQKSVIEHKTAEADSRSRAGLPTNECKSSIGRANIELANAKKDLEHWKSIEVKK